VPHGDARRGHGLVCPHKEVVDDKQHGHLRAQLLAAAAVAGTARLHEGHVEARRVPNGGPGKEEWRSREGLKKA